VFTFRERLIPVHKGVSQKGQLGTVVGGKAKGGGGLRTAKEGNCCLRTLGRLSLSAGGPLGRLESRGF